MMKDGMNPMSVEFLYELFATALNSETICGVVARHVKKIGRASCRERV